MSLTSELKDRRSHSSWAALSYRLCVYGCEDWDRAYDFWSSAGIAGRGAGSV
jgi:hypothetical protein